MPEKCKYGSLKGSPFSIVTQKKDRGKLGAKTIRWIEAYEHDFYCMKMYEYLVYFL